MEVLEGFGFVSCMLRIRSKMLMTERMSASRDISSEIQVILINFNVWANKD